MAKKKTEPKQPGTLFCAFGGVSIGNDTVRVGVEFSRAVIDVKQADSWLCCKRLNVVIKAMANGAHPDQPAMPGMEDGADYEVSGVADVKGFSAGGKTIRCGLTFALASVDIEALSHFAKRNGSLTIEDMTDIEEDDEEES